MVEDMITLLESTVQPELRKGRYPDAKGRTQGLRGRQGGRSRIGRLSGRNRVYPP